MQNQVRPYYGIDIPEEEIIRPTELIAKIEKDLIDIENKLLDIKPKISKLKRTIEVIIEWKNYKEKITGKIK